MSAVTPTQLTIYNGALAVIGERRLVTATENREARRYLDDVWDRGGVRTCLSMGLWNFAGRSIQFNFDPDYTPPWGFQCAFGHPTDWVRWMAVCVDPCMYVPLLQYMDEGGYLFCDLQQIWVKYVSDDAKFGTNYAAWPDNFQRYVEAYFASKIALRLTGSKDTTAEAEKTRDKALAKAKSTDAMNEATALLPPGNWSQARHGRRQNYDRGNPWSLYG